MSFRPTAPQLQKIRQPFQSADLYLSVYEPPVLFAAQLQTGTTFTPADIYLPYYNVMTGSYLNIEYGQTLYIGSTPYNDDLGRVRIISGSATNIKVAPNKVADYQSQQYITIRDFHEIWTVQPRAEIQDPTTRTFKFYKDLDIQYSDQNQNYDPVINMGSHYAGFFSGTSSMTYFDASDSFAGLSNITNIVWYFPTGSSSFIVTGTTPGWINLPNVPGHYTVKATAYSANGKFRSSWRHYSLYNKTNFRPIGDWVLDELTGSYEEGWTAKISVGDGVDRFKDGYLCILFADQNFGSEEIAFGPVYGQERIIFVGYVNQADTVYNAFTNKTTITLRGSTPYLKNKEMYSVTVEYAETPIDWTQLRDMNINRIVYHYLRWHTTVLDVCDFYPNLTGHGNNKDQFEDIPKNEILNSVTAVTRRVFGTYTSDRLGRTFFDVDLNMMFTGTRPSSYMAWQDTDWINSPQYTEVIDKPLSFVQLGGVSFDPPTQGTGTAFLSRAPGDNPGIGYTGKSETLDGLCLGITGTQTYVNELAGLYFAKRNNRYTNLNFTTSGYFPNIDVVPSAFYDFNLASGTTFRHTIFNPIRIIPRNIKINFKNNALNQEIQWETESYGHPGETYIMPVDPVDTQPGGGGDDGIIPTPGPTPDVGGRQTWVTTSSKVGYTTDLTATSPHWVNKTGIIASTLTGGEAIRDFVLDPFDPTHSAYVLTKTAVWHTNNADAVVPAWQRIFSVIGTGANQFAAAYAPEMTRICSTIALKGRYFFTVFRKLNTSDSAPNLMYVYRLTNGTLVDSVAHPIIVNLGDELYINSHTYIDGSPYTGGADTIYNGATGLAFMTGGGRIKFWFSQTLYTGDEVQFRPVNSAYIYYLIHEDGSNGYGGLEGPGNKSVTIPHNTIGVYMEQVGGGGYLGLEWMKAIVHTTYHSDISTVNYALDAGDHNPNMYFYSNGINAIYAPGLYLAQGANDILCPYVDNPQDKKIYLYTVGGDLYRYDFTTSTLTGPLLTHAAVPAIELNQRINVYVGNNSGNDVIALRNTSSTLADIKISGNMGSSFSAGATGITSPHKLGIWPSNKNRQFLLSASNILYSTDGGNSFSNKNGDWSTVMGESYVNGTQIVPNWSLSE